MSKMMHRYKSILIFVSGILAGLVVITPAAGVVHPVGALILGAISATACYGALALKIKLGYDDSLDCFGIHGVGSGLGVILLPFFVRRLWMAGAVAANPQWTVTGQLLVQLTGIATAILLAFAGTLCICVFVGRTIGFRLDEAREKAGLDHSLHGEQGYGLLDLN